MRQVVEARGLLHRQATYYIYQLAFVLSLLAAGVTFLVVLQHPWLQMLNAAFLAFVFTQLCFIAHDAGHRQIFQTAWRNDLLALVMGNLLLGLSRAWWIDKHNLHHGNPNHVGLDPDVDIAVLAFSRHQAQTKRGFQRFIVKHQMYLFIPLLALEAWNMRLQSIQFLAAGKARSWWVEALPLAIHFVLYVGLVFSSLGAGYAVSFILVHQALFGIYLGLSFATNHKGMRMLDGVSQMDFLRRQLCTTRNLTAHPVTDFVFGPLGCQIEHHLFPHMPRNRLRACARIVKAFCQQQALPYHETGVIQSYLEISRYLHEVADPLRRRRADEGER